MSKLSTEIKAMGLLSVLLLPLCGAAQQQDTIKEKPNTLAIDANLMTRGELRYGGFPAAPEFGRDHA